MKLALVNLNRDVPDPPLGLAYLASYVRKFSDVDVVIIDKEDPIERIQKEKPDVIGIGAMTYEFPQAKRLAQQIKERWDIPLILGGHHLFLMPNHFASSNFDIGVMREGEQTLLELMQLFEKNGGFNRGQLKKIDGLIFQENGNTITTKPRLLIEPLDKIPYPARDLLKMKKYYLTLRKAVFGKFGVYASMLTSRGCPFNCTFCSTTLFWQRARFHSTNYVIGEIREIYEKYNVDGILIFDDLFIANKERLKKLSAEIKKEFGDKIEFYIYARANLITPEVCQYLKDMNVKTAEFGLESGSEKTLKFLKKGSITIEDNRRALKICKEFGIRTYGSFIVGSPDETEEDLKQTLALIKDENLDGSHVYQLTPYPGTEIWAIAKKMGVVSDAPDFDLEKIYLMQFKPELIMTKKMSEEKFTEWFWTLENEANKKLYRVDADYIFSDLKFKHLKYMLNPRFMRKMLSNWKTTLRYLKNLHIGKRK